MADLNDQSVEGAGASDQPAETAKTPDLDEIARRAAEAAVAAVDKRFQGFQSLIDRKFKSIEHEFKTAGLSPEEQEQLAVQDKDARIAELEREVELSRLAGQFPRGAELLRKLSDPDAVTSLEDQLSLIEAAFQSGAISSEQAAQAAQAAVDSDADQTPVPEVDRNNPARQLKPGLRSAIEAGDMNDEIADAILELG